MQTHNNHLRRSAQIHLQEENMVKLTAEEKAAAKLAKQEAAAAQKQLQADTKAAVKAAAEQRKAELAEAFDRGYAKGVNSGYSDAAKGMANAVKIAKAEGLQKVKDLSAAMLADRKAALEKQKVDLETKFGAQVTKAVTSELKSVAKELKAALKLKSVDEVLVKLRGYLADLEASTSGKE